MTTNSRSGYRCALSLVAATAVAGALAPAAIAAEELPTNPRECVDAKLVWVTVDFGKDSNKPSAGGCTDSFATGIEALKSVNGLDVKTQDSEYGEFVESINGVKPVWSEDNPAYWSYFNGTVGEDYTVTYKASSVGASSFKPAPGSVEAWVVGDGELQPALQKLPQPQAPENSSADNGVVGIIGAIAAILAVVGGVLAALHAGIFTIPGWENFKH